MCNPARCISGFHCSSDRARRLRAWIATIWSHTRSGSVRHCSGDAAYSGVDMSVAHPIISITGSSGAGTTSVRRTFETIFHRENINAAYIEGDAFHRYDRQEMRRVMAAEAAKGNRHFSHFGPEANLFSELEATFKQFGRTGTGRTRHYVHDDEEAKLYGLPAGNFTPWEPFPEKCDLLFYEGLHGAVVTD